MDEERGRHRVDRYFGATRDPGSSRHSGRSIRERVRKAAFAVFCERGFSGASMLEIATRAQVSKRDLYALFGKYAFRKIGGQGIRGEHFMVRRSDRDRLQMQRGPNSSF